MSDIKFMNPLPVPIAPEKYQKAENSYVVHGATVKCTCGEDSTTTLVIPDRGAHTGYGPKAMDADGTSANFAAPFKKCIADPDKGCTLSPLNGTWDVSGKYIAYSQVPYSQGDTMIPSLLHPLDIYSTLICWKGGIISIKDNGQNPEITGNDEPQKWIYFYDSFGISKQVSGGSGYGGITYLGTYSHQGIDVCIDHDSDGNPKEKIKVLAVCDGDIIAYGKHKDMGNWVAMRTKDEYEVTKSSGEKITKKLVVRYLHMQFPLLVPKDYWTDDVIKKYESVPRKDVTRVEIPITQGTPLGYVGKEGAFIGKSPIAHLHFDINFKEEYWGNLFSYPTDTVNPQEMYPGVKFPCD